MKKIQKWITPLDASAMTEPVSMQTAGAESQLPDIATVIMIICRVIGIIDSYRAGSLQDKGK
jgi:hypothetical protein